MSWLSDVFAGGAKGVLDGVGGVVDRFVTTGDEKNAMKLELEKVVTQRMNMAAVEANTQMQAKERVLVAELNQSDSYTKRARPTVVYMGLVFIGLNYCIVPALQQFTGVTVAAFNLPTEFWVAWGGIVATWSLGRSAEKVGTKNKVTTLATGSKNSLLD